VREKFFETDSAQRAIELVSPQIPSRSLDVLGRCDRSGECESTSPAGTAGGLAAQLHVLNGDVLNGKLRSQTGRLATLVSDKKNNKEILQQFYLRALCRYPTATEREFWLDQFSKADENEARRSVLEDFVWSLLTSQEFRTNH